MFARSECTPYGQPQNLDRAGSERQATCELRKVVVRVLQHVETPVMTAQRPGPGSVPPRPHVPSPPQAMKLPACRPPGLGPSRKKQPLRPSSFPHVVKGITSVSCLQSRTPTRGGCQATPGRGGAEDICAAQQHRSRGHWVAASHRAVPVSTLPVPDCGEASTSLRRAQWCGCVVA